jgi:type II secretory pathway pseudopilin PulG
MAGASSFIDGAMRGYSFVDGIQRQNKYDAQREETHGALMKARELSNKANQWTVDDEADRRRASEFATGKMNVPPGQMDPMAMPAQSDMTEAVPGVEVAPLPRAGVVPPVTGDATAPMPGLEKVNPLPARMATAVPDAPAGPAPMQGAAPAPAQAPAAPAAAPGMPTATLSQGARRQQQAEMAAQAAALRQQWYMENGKGHLALKDMEEMAPKLEQFRNQAWGDAMKRYAISQNPDEFVKAYKFDVDGFDVTGFKPAGKNAKGEEVFDVAYTIDGKPGEPRQMTRPEIEMQARQAADPAGYNKMLDDRRKTILESQMRQQEKLIDGRFQKAGNFLVDTQSGKVFDGNQKPLDEFRSAQEEDADGTKRLVIYSTRTGQRVEVGGGADDPSVALPKAVRKVADDASAAVDKLLGADTMGGMTGDNAKLAGPAREMASSLIAANHRDNETYAGLTPSRAADIGLKVARGEIQVGVFKSGPYKGERGVEYLGQKYLTDPYAWQKYMPGRGAPAAAPGQAPAAAPAAPAAPPPGMQKVSTAPAASSSAAPAMPARTAPPPAAAPASGMTTAESAQFDVETRQIERGRMKDYSPEVKAAIARVDAERTGRNDAAKARLQEQEMARARASARAAQGDN